MVAAVDTIAPLHRRHTVPAAVAAADIQRKVETMTLTPGDEILVEVGVGR